VLEGWRSAEGWRGRDERALAAREDARRELESDAY
jgi:hypothetical protein